MTTTAKEVPMSLGSLQPLDSSFAPLDLDSGSSEFPELDMVSVPVIPYYDLKKSTRMVDSNDLMLPPLDEIKQLGDSELTMIPDP